MKVEKKKQKTRTKQFQNKGLFTLARFFSPRYGSKGYPL